MSTEARRDSRQLDREAQGLAVGGEPAAFAGKEMRIVIAGAGLSGILKGIRLKQRGMHNFRILEKASDLGGTWRDNRYPGVSCDTPGHAYVYSFALNPDYKTRYAPGAEILAYYRRVAKKFGVIQHLTYNAEVLSAEWTGRSWRIEAANGEELEAEVFISACGRLHQPKIPDIPGLADFAGPWFHSARWDPSVGVRRKRVGVIGTGSSAAQIISALPSQVERLVVFQRSPHWFIDPPNTRLSLAKRLKLRFIPGEARKYYEKLHAFGEGLARQRMQGGEAGQQVVADFAHAALAKIRDPELRRKLTPDYAVGCKRIVICAAFAEAIQQPNVELEVEGITRVEAEGVRLRDGRLQRLDVLCLATGFRSDAYMRPMTLKGKDGVTLDELWADSFVNYRTVALPQMPNFFMINGPFSPGGTSPIVRVAEIQTGYVIQLIDRLAEQGGCLYPDDARTRALVAEIQDRAKQTVWFTGGCESWYLDRNGVPLVDPVLPSEMAKAMKTAHFADFVHEPAQRL